MLAQDTADVAPVTQLVLYARLPEWVLYHPELEPLDVRLYAHLVRRCGTRGWWYGSQEADMAAPLRVSVRTVARSLGRLRAAGAIDWVHRYNRHGQGWSTYRFAYEGPGQWAAEVPDADDRPGSVTDGRPTQRDPNPESPFPLRSTPAASRARPPSGEVEHARTPSDTRPAHCPALEDRAQAANSEVAVALGARRHVRASLPDATVQRPSVGPSRSAEATRRRVQELPVSGRPPSRRAPESQRRLPASAPPPVPDPVNPAAVVWPSTRNRPLPGEGVGGLTHDREVAMDGVHATPQLALISPQTPEIHRGVTPGTVTTLLTWQVPQVVRESPHLETAVRLCELMARQIEDRGYVGAAGKCHQKRWVLDMEKMLRIDGREPAQVERVLAWLDRGADEVALFWQTNILSPAKLRLQWDRMAHQYRNLRRRQIGGRSQGLAEATGVDARIRRTLAENRERLELSRG